MLVLSPIALFVIAAYGRRWMHDDGFIDLRIVRNVLEGHGFVFNIGERVEATTSALWVMYLVVLGALGARLEDAAVYAGLAFSTAALGLAELAAFRHATGNASRDKNHWILPLGAALYAALPPAWDFATSGLETGMAILWLSGSYLAVVTLGSERGARHSTASWLAAAALIGLGWLIRPELALYALAMLVPLSYGFDSKLRARGTASSGRTQGAIAFLFAAGALPGGYQIFRMGYFGAMTANPALAKEAFRANLPQGWCYFHNFFDRYWLAVPIAALVILFALNRPRRRSTRQALGMTGWASALVVAAAATHVGYIVILGGDYMHGRMFLPPIFAASLPFSVVVMRAPDAGRSAWRWMCFLPAGVLLGWAVRCASSLRVDPANQCSIGDERGWYVAQARRANPVRIDDFAAAPFYDTGRQVLRRLAVNCPSALWPSKDQRSVCRRMVDLESEEGDELAVNRVSRLVAPSVDSAVKGVVAYGAIGILGYLLPSSVHLVDRHGLADPVGARLQVKERGRPGHEKRLNDAWILARFTAKEPADDAALVAARNALGCWKLPALLERARAPFSWEIFLENIAQASRMQRVRIAADPFTAEERFCQAPTPTRRIAGGEGGAPFEWRSPSGVDLVGIRGAIDDNAGAIAEMGPLFQKRRGEAPAFGAEARFIEGKRKGQSSDHPFDLQCPAGTILAGLRGRASNLVHQIGLLCTNVRPVEHEGRIETPLVGVEAGEPFELVCPEEAELIGVTGRSGSLIDAAGLVCGARAP
jgi:arabinofuranosyltransferase